jgi:hypothetical protein
MLLSGVYGAGDASGKLNTTVASRNAGGLYLRGKVDPIQPNSEYQAATKGRMVQLSAAWSRLTPAQRDSWLDYAITVSVSNRIGAQIHLSTRNWYIAMNSLRLQAGLASVANGPSVLSLAQISAPTISCNAAATVSVAFTNTDEWATSTGGALLLFVSRGVSPTRSFFKGPYRYAGKISGATTAATSPTTISIPFSIANGQRVFWKAVATSADGRKSSEVTGFCVAAIS